jgi:predicted nuclease of predicted toxin-antitoxin system
MRLLADENFPKSAVEALREAGHDVAWVSEETSGIADSAVLARAIAEERILLTMDKDFGELAFRERLPASCGVILLRVAPESPVLITQLVAAALNSRADWAGHFSVVERDRIRMTPLPNA